MCFCKYKLHGSNAVRWPVSTPAPFHSHSDSKSPSPPCLYTAQVPSQRAPTIVRTSIHPLDISPTELALVNSHPSSASCPVTLWHTEDCSKYFLCHFHKVELKIDLYAIVRKCITYEPSMKGKGQQIPYEIRYSYDQKLC